MMKVLVSEYPANCNECVFLKTKYDGEDYYEECALGATIDFFELDGKRAYGCKLVTIDEYN